MKELIFDCYGEEFNLTAAMEQENGAMFKDSLEGIIRCYKGINLPAVCRGERLTDEEVREMKEMAEQELEERCYNAIFNYIRMKRGYSSATVSALYKEYWPAFQLTINN